MTDDVFAILYQIGLVVEYVSLLTKYCHTDMFFKTLCFLLLLGLLPTGLSSQDRLDYAVEHISKDLKKRAAAVVRADHTEVYLESRDQYTSRHRQVVTILNDKGAELADFRAYYKEGTEKIKDIKINYYDKDGRHLKSIKNKEIEDFIAYDGISMISDGRVKSYDAEIIDYPITVDMSWEEVSTSTLFIPFWTPLSYSKVSVEKSSYKLHNQTSIDLRTSERNFEGYDIVSHDGYHYELHDQKVASSEKYTPSFLERKPMVIIAPQFFTYEGYKGSYSDWASLGTWVYEDLLMSKKDLDHDKVRMDLADVISDGDDKETIVRKLYDYVQENTRYILIGLDEGGLVPLSTNKVHEVKYGDCKALSFYMKDLLEAYGVTANYVIVRAKVERPESIFSEYPHTFPANHIILNVPLEQDTIWLDCTSHDSPFNFLGDFTDDRIALQVSKEGGTLVKTPTYGKELNKQVIDAEVVLDKTGDVDVDLTIEEYGIQIDQGIRLQGYDKDEMDEYLKTNLLRHFDNVSIQDYTLGLDEELIKTTQRYEYEADKFVEKAGDYMIMPASFISLSVPRLKKDSRRDNEILFPRERQSTSHVTYEVPVGYRMRIPDDIVLDSAYGTYTQKVTEVAPQKFEIYRDFVLHKGRYAPEMYDEIKLYFDKIIKAERTKYSMTNKS